VKKLLLSFIFATLGCGCTFVESAAAETPALSFPGETIKDWHGFKQHNFKVDGCAAWVVEPKVARPGQPWAWSLAFPDNFTDRCAAPQLLTNGFYFVHLKVGNTFGSPDALKHLNAFYELLAAHGFAKKAALIGLSRGGLAAYRFAADYPDRVAVIYGDAAVCDFKSWPGGKGKGQGSRGDWRALIKCYGFKDEVEALAYPGNPIDRLEPLAKAKIALIHVVGDADDTVPPAENAEIIEKRYKALGGTFEIIHKPGVNHHPHGLDDPTPVVKFILEHAAPR